MIGLVMKDCFVQRRTMLLYLGFVIFYMFMSIVGSFPASSVAGVGSMMGFLMSTNSFSYDDQVKWDTFAAMMPNGRRNVVLGKYLYTLLMSLGSGAVIAVVLTVLSALGLTDSDIVPTLLTVVMCMITCLLLSSIVIPVLFKFGVEKGRIIYMMVFVVVFGGGALSAFVMSSAGIILPEPSELDVLIFVLIFIAVVILMMAASVFLSLWIYKKKEF